MTAAPLANNQPWELIPGETSAAYKAFCVYRDMGDDRSLQTVAYGLNVSIANLSRWSRKYKWVERCRQYDAHLLDEQRKRRRKNRVKTVDDHLALATELLQSAAVRMRPAPLVDKAGQPVIDPATNRPYLIPADAQELTAAANALDKAIRHQRLALGLPTEATKQDLVLRETLQQTLATQQKVREIIEYRICPDCRAKIGADLRAIAAQQRDAAEAVSDD